MLTLNDERNELWQWDTGRKLTVDADCSQVHFSNKVFGRSIDVDVVDGVAIIPDILLQTDKDLNAWAFVGTAESGYTKISKVFKVNKRNKPADYVFTPTDQTTLGEILDRIEDLENRPSGDVSKEDIQDAVNDYLDKNPVSVEEKDPTVPNWAKQPNPPKQPNALPNPHKLNFTGAVQAEYDGSKEVTVEIPEGGGGGIEVTGAEVGQTIVVKAVDENGKPTEWGTNFSTLRLLNTLTLTEEVATIELSSDDNGKPYKLRRLVLLNGICGGTLNANKSSLIITTNGNDTAATRLSIANGVYTTGAQGSSIFDVQMLSKGIYFVNYGLSTTSDRKIYQYFYKHWDAEYIHKFGMRTSTEGYTFGIGTKIYVCGEWL